MAPKLVTNNKKPNFRNKQGQFTSKGGRFRVDTLSAGLANFEFKMRENMERIALDFCNELVDYAKANAPWTDQTGDARQGLDGQVDGEDGTLNVTLFHTVDYGVWLEIRWGGTYAIILPTVEKKGSELLQRWEGLMREIIFYE